MNRKIKGSTVLVTGGAGFIGSTLVERLLKEGAKEIIVVDNLFCGREDNLPAQAGGGAVVLYKEDAEFASSLEYIFYKHEIDIVINCATKALNYSFVNPANAFSVNTNIVINLLELLRKQKYKTLCHFSTSEVYGTAIYEPMDEAHPKNPMTAYAAGKAAADIAVETYVRMFNLDAFIFRPFNNYGPKQNYRGYLSGVIPITAYRIYKSQKPIVYGTGSQTRDFIFVEDTIDALIKIFPIIKQGESINVSANSQIAIIDVVKKICDLMNYTGEIDFKPKRDADVECHNADNEKIKSLIDYQLTSFEYGITKTIDWYQKEFLRFIK
ncbi:MAG: GDP-mannose 4,6-dehydratase [Bacteroidales bacterium]|jgi:UDP-glucose 4-epimerase|nr:GDP-mannose 4,6-dehydratase [Bacteroidales bacterium]